MQQLGIGTSSKMSTMRKEELQQSYLIKNPIEEELFNDNDINQDNLNRENSTNN